MKLSVAVAVFLVAICPLASYGVTWENYGVLGSENMTIAKYYVGSPIEIIDEHTFQLWYKVEGTRGEIIIITTEYLEINCKNRTKTVLQRTVIDSTGKKSDNTDVGVASYIEPQSIYERFADDYCKAIKAVDELKKSGEEPRPDAGHPETGK